MNTKNLSTSRKLLKLMPRAAAILMMLVGPVLAVPTFAPKPDRFIEARPMHNSGAGLVLLVALQRRS